MKKLFLVFAVVAGTAYAAWPTQPDNQQGWGDLHPDLIYFSKSL